MGIFNLFAGGLSVPAMIFYFVAWILVVLIAFTCHEYAHAYAATKMGDVTPRATGRLTLNPMAHIDPMGMLLLMIVGFGWAKPVAIDPNQFRNYKKGMVWVSIAGVLTNFVLGIAGMLLYSICFMAFDQTLAVTYILDFLLMFAQINFVLGIFNLLPIYPLDGFMLLSTFLRYDSPFIIFMRRYGYMLLLVFIIFGVTGLVIGGGLDLLTTFFFKLFTWSW